MGINFATRRIMALGSSYADKVLSYDPIAYWPLNEGGGTIARCLVNTAQNGTYSSDVATMGIGPGIGDGNTAAYFDGVNDYVNVQTAALAAAFNGAAGTSFSWIRVANAGVWTDGTRRDMFFTQVDGNNYIVRARGVANNITLNYYVAGGVAKNVNPAGLSTTAWVTSAITWDKAADEVRVYWAGAQSGATQNGLGNWAGAIVVSVIGATSVVPANPWQGWLAHTAFWDRALTPGAIADLSNV